VTRKSKRRAKSVAAPSVFRVKSGQWQDDHDRLVRRIRDVQAEILRLGYRGNELVFPEDNAEHGKPRALAAKAVAAMEGPLALLENLWSRVVGRGNPNL
jgi:hypothetical protein